MAIPWLTAIRMIPWSILLSNGPAMAKAADALLSVTKAQRAQASAAADEIRRVSERVATLESHDRAHAELVKQMSDQIEALTLATEVLAVRQRWLAVAGAVLFLVLLAVVVERG
jgi:hypothetical protein